MVLLCVLMVPWEQKRRSELADRRPDTCENETAVTASSVQPLAQALQRRTRPLPAVPPPAAQPKPPN